jgi:hypothetical protein
MLGGFLNCLDDWKAEPTDGFGCFGRLRMSRFWVVFETADGFETAVLVLRLSLSKVLFARACFLDNVESFA